MKETIADAKKMVELGGDWDRRNRLKVIDNINLFLRN